MIIKAKFTGTNSLGYEKNKEYNLKISKSKQITIKRMDDTGFCFYESLHSFLVNWTNIIAVTN